MRTRFAALLAPFCWPLLAYKVPKRDIAARVAELETKHAALDNKINVCCATTVASLDADRDLEVMVRLRTKVADLEKRVKALEEKGK